MIKKVTGVYFVSSKEGKPLSKVYKSKSGAQKRLDEIEYFKHRK